MTTTPPAPITSFRDRPSPLLDIVRACASGEVDWPTTKAALLAYHYAPAKPKLDEAANPDAYAKNYLLADMTDAAPGTFGELTTAAHLGMIEWERYMEVLTELTAPPAP